MCIVCTQYEKGKLTLPEANKALVEIYLSGDVDPDHARELVR